MARLWLLGVSPGGTDTMRIDAGKGWGLRQLGVLTLDFRNRTVELLLGERNFTTNSIT